MKKKLLVGLLAATASLCCAFGLSACGKDGKDDKNDSNEWGSEYSVQSAYAVAQNLGYTGSLEEFIDMISGKDGKDGVGIDNAYIDEEGCLILVLTNNKTINCGKVSTSNVEKQDFQYVTIKENNEVTGYSIIGINTGTVVDSDLIIPSSYQGKPVKEIATEAFKDNKYFTSVTIPDSITTIGNSAFSGCTDLATVKIGSGVTSIGSYAFDNCSSLAEIRYAGDMSSWCGLNVSGLMRYGTKNRKLFIDNVEIKGNLVIPNSVTTVGRFAFNNCSLLVSITIPNSVTTIGDYAFSGCSSLTSITIPNSVTSIGSWAFALCTNLTNITIPNSVTIIGSSAFENCSSLKSVTLSSSLTSIQYATFGGCSSLTSVTIPNTVTFLEFYSFKDCSSLTDITYDGTKEQWKAVKKEISWCPENIKIHCEDGDIS
ncbi:MAG: leucine-rich repeat domain-containing protein [Clostridia bacterium]|nr:leucine-rich repeat domain-containing protein [Clostridia bacterium]